VIRPRPLVVVEDVEGASRWSRRCSD